MTVNTPTVAPTPLASFVRERLNELGIKQSDFCRLSTFDQGLLSKIQNSVVTSLSLESVLKLALGLSVPPRQLFQLLDRQDMHELVLKSYAAEFSELLAQNTSPEVASEAGRVMNEVANKELPPHAQPRRRRWQPAQAKSAVASVNGNGHAHSAVAVSAVELLEQEV